MRRTLSPFACSARFLSRIGLTNLAICCFGSVSAATINGGTASGLAGQQVAVTFTLNGNGATQSIGAVYNLPPELSFAGPPTGAAPPFQCTGGGIAWTNTGSPIPSNAGTCTYQVLISAGATPGVKQITMTQASCDNVCTFNPAEVTVLPPSTPPTISYLPGPGSSISLMGGSGTAGSIATATITASASGGSGSGAAATTTIDGCAFSGPGSGAFGTPPTPLSFVGGTGGSQQLSISCARTVATESATLTCTETASGGPGTLRSWPVECPAGSPTNIAPTLAYDPAPGAVIDFDGSSAGPVALASISITPSGGAGSGPAATTSVASCVIGGADAGQFGGPSESPSFVGSTNQIQRLTLACTQAATPLSATLNCAETAGSPGVTNQRSWSLRCPAETTAGTTLVYNPPAGESVGTGGPVNFVGVSAAGSTGIAAISVTPASGSGTTNLSSISINGANAASFLYTGPATLTLSGDAPSTQQLPLRCLAGATPQTANLQAIETVGGGTSRQRFWVLSCPAGAEVAPPELGDTSLEATSVNGGLPNGDSLSPALNRNGTRMVYVSRASDIVNGDTNGREDIFFRDRVTATTTRISALAEALAPGLGEGYVDPAISADGDTVAFSGTSGQVYAVAAGAARRISMNARGESGNADSANPFPISNGSIVFFDSQATNLLSSTDQNAGVRDIFARNMLDNSVTLISRAPNGAPADGPSAAPHASADGSTVVFHTLAENIVASSANGFPATKLAPGVKSGTIRQVVVVRNGGFGQGAFYVSRNRTTGVLGNGDSINSRISPDGRWVVFESLASNLISGDTNGVSDIFRAEIINNQVINLERVSVGRNGEQSNGASRNAQISDDGLLVTFETDATNLATPDNNNASDILIKSMLTGDILRQNAENGQLNSQSAQPSISGDGGTLGFTSNATNIATGDNNNSADVFSTAIANRLPRDEPTLVRFALPPPASFPSCPAGFFIASVTDGPGAGLSPGAFGMEVLLDEPGTRTLAGGLNFGGLIDVGQVGFAGFTIANAANENQRLNLSLTGSPSSSSTAGLQVRIRIARRTASTSNTVFESIQVISLQTPFVSSIDLTPGFYEVTVAPVSGVAGGAPEGQFYFSLTTSFINRPGGGFQGGAVVGGYHATHPFGGVSGFAAICLATPHSTSIRVLSQPSYGPTGGKDLRLQIQDSQRRDVVVVPAR